MEAQVIGQGSLLIHPNYCWLKAVFLVNSRSQLFSAPFYKGLLIANVRRQFAEFLKDNSAITLAHLCPSTLVSFSTVKASLFFPVFFTRVLKEVPINFGLSLNLRGRLTPQRSSFCGKPWIYGVFF